MTRRIATESIVVDGRLVRAGRAYDDGKTVTKKERDAAEKAVRDAQAEVEKATTDDARTAAQAKLSDAKAALAALDA